MNAPFSPAPDAELLICSAKACREPARWALRWNNPRIHTEERRKNWLACDDHKEGLAEFLRIRGFLREVEPLS
ncbi:hypothetical protein HC028_12750 [Planosporangium flavigriseum]|nr:hypothetical protein [Planosporangium flavigriseum]NJC65366.1 hypothetical protein [Planosporangium flavigriseum]